MYLLALLTLAAVAQSINGQTETFTEELVIKPLESGHLLAHFRFVHLLTSDHGFYSSYQHFQTFPRSFWEITQLHKAREIHFALTQGHWKTKSWGYPPRSAPAGAELLAWFQPEVTDVDSAWALLTNGLSGLFCSSLNFVNAANTATPRFSFGLDGLSHHQLNGSQVRYAALPSEVVCTENLTPWKKLLPCDVKRGLASLLNPKYVFNSNYHSLAVDFRPVCSGPDCTSVSYELALSLTMLTEPSVMNSASLGKQDWSLRTTFGGGLFSACPLASVSKIYVDVSQNRISPSFRLLPDTEVQVSLRGGSLVDFAVYDVRESTEDGALNVRAIYNKPIVYGVIPPPLLYAVRFLSGFGNERGTVVTQITNSRASESVRVVYMEVLPWFLRVIGHTMKIFVNSKQIIKPDLIHFVPGRDRVRAHHLELVLTVPPLSVVEVHVEFEKAFLKWHEYPPDANHGFDIPAAVVSAFVPVARNYTALPQTRSTFHASMNVSSPKGYLVRIHTETLVVIMATPDFSMPYNVICLTCTVVALAFGPLHNFTTKRLVKRLPKENKLKKLSNSLSDRLSSLLKKGNSHSNSAEDTISSPEAEGTDVKAKLTKVTKGD